MFVAAFLYRTPLWASVVVTATVGLLIVVSSHFCLVRRNRPFTLTFLVTGWLYLAVSFLPFLSQVHRFLFPTRLLGDVWLSLTRVPNRTPGIKIGEMNTTVDDSASAIDAAVEPFHWVNGNYYLELRSFFYIGDCVAAILLATLAGVIGSYCVRRSYEAKGSGRPFEGTVTDYT